MTQFVWLGGLFHNKQSVCVCVHAGICLLIICCRCSRLYTLPYQMVLSFLSLLHQSWPQPAPNSTGQVMFSSLSGEPQAGNLSQYPLSTDPAVYSVIRQKFQHHLSVGPWHTLEESIWKGTQTNCEAEAKSLRPASLLVLLFLGSEIRHAVSKATTFDRLGRKVGWLMKCS